MAKKAQTKKRSKLMSKTSPKPSFAVKNAAPKSLFGNSGNTGGMKNTSSMRSPGSQRKR